MIRKIGKKIIASALALTMVASTVVYAEPKSTLLTEVKESVESGAENDPQTIDLVKVDEAMEANDIGEAANLIHGLDGENVPSASEPFSWKDAWLHILQSAAGIAIDVAEEEGLLDNQLTTEGYETLRELAQGITDPELRQEALSGIADSAAGLVLQIVISCVMPYIIEAVDYLDSVGIGSDEIVELAGLIPEEYQPIVKEVLAYMGVFGITDPNDTLYPAIYEDRDQTWAIYMYCAGNDLETRNWAATHDLEEIMQTSLPENVKVVIESGGATYWHNDYMDSDYQNRCVYDSEGIHEISQEPRQNMGEQETLEGFLDWCTSEYPADKTMLIFWGHGSATDGVCLDENYENDALTLTEIKGAVDNVFGKDREEAVFDVVGFDACLMAAIETASVCSEFASYLAASEETEPGNGWAYHSILGQIAATPEITMEQLGDLLTTSYLFNNTIGETDAASTFSYVNLEKVNALVEAYDDLGKAVLERYREDPAVKDEIFHLAADAEAYGAMGGFRGGNQIDLGDFAAYLEPLFPEESQKVLDALEECVVCMDNGTARDHSCGLSCMFPFTLTADSLKAYKDVAASESFDTYYEEAGYYEDAVETEAESEISDDEKR